MPTSDREARRKTRRLVYLIVVALPSVIWAQLSDRARTLHHDALVFDAHVHVVNRQFYHGGDMGERVDDGQFDLPRAREGGLDAMFFSLFVTEQYYPARVETQQVLRLVDAAYEQLARNKDKIELAFNASDVERISATGKIAAFMDLEGGFDLDGDLAVLRNLYRLGLRSFQLPAHNWANSFADSCCAPPGGAASTIAGAQSSGKPIVSAWSSTSPMARTRRSPRRSTSAPTLSSPRTMA